jgi:diaminopimelate epimerase
LDRHFSIGADTLLSVRSEGPAIRYRVFEAGLEIDMCGNGLRCVARYFMEKLGLESLEIIPRDGIVKRVGREGDAFCVQMGRMQAVNKFIAFPLASLEILRADRLPVDRNRQDILKALGVDSKNGYMVNSGEPHLVFLIGEEGPVDLRKLGEEIRTWREVFPAGINLDLVQRIGQDAIKIRTYERGAFQETLCCGTGSVASAFVGKRIFPIEVDTIRVLNPGGQVSVRFKGEEVFMTGPAEKVFSGEIELRLES